MEQSKLVHISQPIKIGNSEYKNRIVMAALTRVRCDPKTNTILKGFEYVRGYIFRAGAGLILSECTSISRRSNGFPGAAGIYTDEQVNGWTKVIQSVHKAGGKMCLQIWHCGRATHSSLQEKLDPWAPSPVAIRGKQLSAQKDHEIPHEMTLDEIQLVQEEFRKGAQNAKKAGFDAIQLHGAHGFLVDQFLRDCSNKRSDNYGGSFENRSRFCLEIIDILISVFGADKVGIKLTPLCRYNDMCDSDPVGLFSFLIKELDKKKVGFIELKDDDDPVNSENYGYPSSRAQLPEGFTDIYEVFKPFYKGVVIANNNFTPEKGNKYIKDGKVQMVSFGRLYISNPDLAERIKNGQPYTKKQDFETFYQGGRNGYTDYPVFKDQAKQLLFQKIKIGSVTYPNRIIMAALTRMRCDPTTQVPNDLLVEYYTQRANAAIILSECTSISPRSNAFPGAAGIWTDEQTLGWKRVCDSVHKAGGKIFLQIYHCGRQTHSKLQNGLVPWAPSPVKDRRQNHFTHSEYEIPHEMTVDEINIVKQEFKVGAQNAKKAGFDGIELHGANGYLVDQFLKDGSNKRVDSYGGSIENRSRFCLEVIDILISVFGPERVGIKVTPIGRYNDMCDTDPLSLFTYLFNELDKRNIGFIELKDDKDPVNYDNYGYPSSEAQIEDLFGALKPHFKGVIVGNNKFDLEKATGLIDDEKIQMASFGQLYITNPDLAIRFKNNYPLNTNFNFQTYFAGGKEGYTDYLPYDPVQNQSPSDLISKSKLFEPLTIGDLTLSNRIVMAAMTRMRCDPTTGVPNELNQTYYSQRAEAGLIITECTSISSKTNSFPGSPGIYNTQQIEGWRKVVDKVHVQKSLIFLQLFHGGRASHSILQGGNQLIAPSAIKIRGQNQIAQKDHEIPLEMTQNDIKQVLDDYKAAAQNAKNAGFDGVQLSAGHGYLIDQFIRDGSNKRKDNYGGSIENRCRFPLEVVDVLINVFGAKRVGVKITPIGIYNDMNDSKPLDTFGYLLQQLEERGVGFVELKDDDDPDNAESYGYKASKELIPDVYAAFKPYFNGVIIANNKFTPIKAEEFVNNDKVQLVSFGKLFITNPDLPYRIKNGLPLNTNYDFGKFYSGGKEGYIDYPSYREGVQTGCCQLL